MKRTLAWICLLGLAACAAPPATTAGRGDGGSLAGTRWLGVIDPALDKRAQPRLEFVGEGRVSGFTGCNMMSGTWRMEGGEIRFGSIAATKRMCLGPEGEVEKRLLAALGSDSRARREGGRLVLTGPGGARFEFVPAGN